jgi:EmrB/QacA subfamily drug resistance transporter
MGPVSAGASPAPVRRRRVVVVARSRSGHGAQGSTDPTLPGFSRALAVLIAGAYFMENLDATIIAPAAPAIAESLGVGAVQINVAMTAYLLTVAVLIPGSGWLSDRYGARGVFSLAIALFTVASIGCAIAPTLGVLTVARVLQGVGGAMMVPVGRLIVLRTTAKAELIKAIAYLTWPALVAPVLAPPLGGLISTFASWRWIFLINVPLGIVGLILARRLVPDVRATEPRRLDWRGFLLTAFGVAALVIGLEQIGTGRPDWAFASIALGLAAITLAWAIGYLLHTSTPLLDLRTLKIRSLRAAVAGGSVFRLVISAIPFLLPLFFQLGFGWSAAQAGVLVVALFLGNLGIKPFTTPLMRWLGIRSVLLIALPMSAVCLLGMGALTASTPIVLMVALLAVSGIFRSVGFSAYNSVAFADVPTDKMTHANTLHATLQELGAGLGIAVGALLVRLGDPISQGLDLAQSPATAYRIAFVLLAVIMLIPLIEALTMPASAGSTVTGRT